MVSFFIREQKARSRDSKSHVFEDDLLAPLRDLVPPEGLSQSGQDVHRIASVRRHVLDGRAIPRQLVDVDLLHVRIVVGRAQRPLQSLEIRALGSDEEVDVPRRAGKSWAAMAMDPIATKSTPSDASALRRLLASSRVTSPN
jgi:hypothetical protein